MCKSQLVLLLLVFNYDYVMSATVADSWITFTQEARNTWKNCSQNASDTINNQYTYNCYFEFFEIIIVF